MAKLYNLARMTTATTGTGTITLGSAVSSYVTFANAGVQNGDTVTYAIADGTNREIGRGVYTSSGTTLTRAQILESTNGGSAISLSGSAEVFITAAGEDITSDVQITGGSITGITDLAVADGGTGKSSFTAYSVLLGGTTSTGALQNVSGLGTSGQVLTSAGAGAIPTWKFPSANLLGTIVTTSGTSASISGLDLTPYKILIVVFDGVSHNSGSSQTLLLGTSTADDIALSTASAFAAADTVRGIVITDLTSGVSTSFVANFASGANGTIPSRFAGLPIRTSSTSVSVAFSAGSLDAGAVYVYGI